MSSRRPLPRRDDLEDEPRLDEAARPPDDDDREDEERPDPDRDEPERDELERDEPAREEPDRDEDLDDERLPELFRMVLLPCSAPGAIGSGAVDQRSAAALNWM